MNSEGYLPERTIVTSAARVRKRRLDRSNAQFSSRVSVSELLKKVHNTL
jgi:hypothetical protein